jgi:hypothetical protein
MLDLFIDVTNKVFWEGYANQLSIDNPDMFCERFKQFTEWYGRGLNTPLYEQSYFIRIIQNNYPLARRCYMLFKACFRSSIRY